MTGKQEIIIDGVDVSGCVNLMDDKTCNLCTTQESGMFCIDNTNCYFKQLQRTQIQYNKIVEQNKSIQQELQRKIEECEELKKFFHIQNIQMNLLMMNF